MSSREGKDQPDFAEIIAAFRGAEAVIGDEVYGSFQVALNAWGEEWRSRGIVRIAPKPRAITPPRLVRGVLGVTAAPLVESLGLLELVTEYILEELNPRCQSCGALAQAPVALESLVLPTEGVLAASASDEASIVSLAERCELLGAERAVVAGKLVRVGDLSHEEGAPIVALVSATEANRLQDEVTRWFSRGGGELSIMHYRHRDEIGVELGRLSGMWRCTTCQTSIPTPNGLTLVETPPCHVCGGAGWIALEEGRRHACRECDGFGSCTNVSRYLVAGVELRYVMALTHSELLRSVERRPSSTGRRLSQYLRVVCDAGFGDYPLGACVDHMSVGERALLTVLVGQLSHITDVTFVLDAGMTGVCSALQIGDGLRPNVVVTKPRAADPCVPVESGDSHRAIVLRDIHYGPLFIPELRVPYGVVTGVIGPIGSGTSLLLDVIESRFAKRKKLASQCDFCELKHVHHFSALTGRGEVLLDLAGLRHVFIREIVRLRVAQEAGILLADLDRANSSYRCEGCQGTGVSIDCETCSECGGALFDWRVARLPLHRHHVDEILALPLSELSGLPWSSDRIRIVVDGLRTMLGKDACLRMPINGFAYTQRRCIALYSWLLGLEVEGRVGSRGNRTLGADLLLIDGPSVLLQEYTGPIIAALGRLKEAGATVICTGVTGALESVCSSVVRLCVMTDPVEERIREPFLDTRYARTSGVVSQYLKG